MMKCFHVAVVPCLCHSKGFSKAFSAVLGIAKQDARKKLRHHFRGQILQRTLLRAVMYDQ